MPPPWGWCVRPPGRWGVGRILPSRAARRRLEQEMPTRKRKPAAEVIVLGGRPARRLLKAAGIIMPRRERFCRIPAREAARVANTIRVAARQGLVKEDATLLAILDGLDEAVRDNAPVTISFE